MKHNFLPIGLWLLWLFGACQGACAADPWPEPDDMQDDDEHGGGDNGDGSESPVPAGEDDDKSEEDGDTGADGDSDNLAPSADATDTDTQMEPGDVGFDTDELEDTEGDTGDTDAYSDVSGTDAQGSGSTDTGWDIDEGMDAGEGEGTRGGTEINDTAPDWGGDAGPDASVGDADVSALSQVYCSAPGPSGTVTIVGLPGTVLNQGEVEILHGGESYAIPVGANGGFAGRFPGGPRETVEVVIRYADWEQERITLATGSLEGGFVGNSITGPDGRVTKLPDEDQVIIHGKGERLDGDHLVIGGNLDAATGSGVWLSCTDAGCSFDLWLPGETGDQVDVFLVPGGKHTGSSDSQTIRIP